MIPTGVVIKERMVPLPEVTLTPIASNPILTTSSTTRSQSRGGGRGLALIKRQTFCGYAQKILD